VKIVDLSIDFDFFSREENVWDWGHDETPDRIFENQAWQYRYTGSSFDLFEATDPRKYADFLPLNILPELVKKGLVLNSMKKLGIAESHKEAAPFFAKAKTPADCVVNIDAHHDLFTDTATALHCGNWVSHLQAEWNTGTEYVQIYPKWKSPNQDGLPKGKVEIIQWSDWTPERMAVRNVFICRSGCWVPPHMDGYFIDMVKTFVQAGATPIVIGDLFERKHPTRKAHIAAIKEHAEIVKMVMAESQKLLDAQKETRQKATAR
jgi:hypothetical protein